MPVSAAHQRLPLRITETSGKAKKCNCVCQHASLNYTIATMPVIPGAGRLSLYQHRVVLTWDRAVRPWQSQREASAKSPRTAESVVTREVEQGSSVAGLESPSQTACTQHNLSALLCRCKQHIYQHNEHSHYENMVISCYLFNSYLTVQYN